MGQLFTGILTGEKTKKQAEDLNDFLTTSEEMLKQKADLFFQKITNSSNDKKEMPVSKFLQSRYEMRVSMTQGVDIGGEVEKVAGTFSDKQFAKGVGQIINSITNIIFGRSTGSSDQEEGYFIVIGTTGAILRIDFLIYLKKVCSKGLISLAQNFYLCCYTISSIDTDNLLYNDIASAVELSFASLPTKDKEALIQLAVSHINKKTL